MTGVLTCTRRSCAEGTKRVQSLPLVSDSTEGKVTRMATVSLRVAHRKDCANASKTALDSLKGCTCKASYYTFHRDRSGRVVKGPRIRDKRVAEQTRTKLQADL